jgi:hypothetical protein
MDRQAFEFLIADGDADEAAQIPADFGDTSHIGSWRRYSRDEFPLFYSRIAGSGGCLLGTSLYEGLPLTILEALACACPVVAMDSRGVNDIMTGSLRQWLYAPEATPDQVRGFLLSSLVRLHRPDALAGLRQHILDHFSVDVMVEGNLAAYQSSLPGQAEQAERANRCAIAESLWGHAEQTLREGGQQRDALFAMRAAARLSPSSLMHVHRIALLLRAGNTSRLSGARACAERASHARSRRDLATSFRETLRAVRIHPGVLFTGR